MTFPKPTIEQVNEEAYLLRFGSQINEQTADQILWTTRQLKRLHGIQDLIPSYTTILLTLKTPAEQQHKQLDDIENILNASSEQTALPLDQRKVVVIPVYYGNEVGPDLQEVATHCQMTPEEVIQRHSATLYRAYTIGFTPGFSFLGSTPDELHIPRKRTPRHKVPKGSVAIAENQTAVYPSVTPGGWQIIGRTPMELVDWSSEHLGLIATGDSVRFEAISREAFLEQGGTLDGF